MEETERKGPRVFGAVLAGGLLMGGGVPRKARAGVGAASHAFSLAIRENSVGSGLRGGGDAGIQ